MKEPDGIKVSDYMQQKLRLLYLSAVRDVAVIVVCCHVILYFTRLP